MQMCSINYFEVDNIQKERRGLYLLVMFSGRPMDTLGLFQLLS